MGVILYDRLHVSKTHSTLGALPNSICLNVPFDNLFDPAQRHRRLASFSGLANEKAPKLGSLWQCNYDSGITIETVQSAKLEHHFRRCCAPLAQGLKTIRPAQRKSRSMVHSCDSINSVG
jgi:hypothetical protein